MIFHGLKENVIVGRLIPAGNGVSTKITSGRKLLDERDKALLTKQTSDEF